MEKVEQKHFSGTYNMVVAVFTDVGRNSDESNTVMPLDRKHDYVHQNMAVHDISKLIMTGLETCFISEKRGTEGATFIKSVSFTS
jgi:hypothetical protein